MRKTLATGLLGLVLLTGCGGAAGGDVPIPAPAPAEAPEAGGPGPDVIPALPEPSNELHSAAPADAPAPHPDQTVASHPDGSTTPAEPVAGPAGDSPSGAAEPGSPGEEAPATPPSKPVPAPVVPVPAVPEPVLPEDPPLPVKPPTPVAPPRPIRPPLERLPGPELPEPGPPENGVRPGDPLPDELRGFAEDDVLSLEVVAVREEADTYRVRATLTNKSGAGVELLFDCGSLVHVRFPGERPDPGRICPAVHSMLFPAGKTIEREFVFDAQERGFPQFAAVYAAHVNGSGRLELRVVLEPVGEE